MSSAAENDPLLPSNSSNTNTSSSQRYYFLNKSDPSYTGGSTRAVTDVDDAGQVVDVPPPNSVPEEFAPRPVGKHKSHPSEVMIPHNGHSIRSNGSVVDGNNNWWSKLFGPDGGSHAAVSSANNNNLNTLKPRKAPVKIEPKVFFANERTFLAWMHLSVVLAGASIAILAFAENDVHNPVSQLYGIVLLPVAVAFIVYSMIQYQRRAKLIRLRHPGPYEDTVGPVVLGCMLMMSITAQFALKLYAMHL